MLPFDMRAHVLRSALDTMAGEIHGASLAPALAARLNMMVADARRHALDLEEMLRPIHASNGTSAPREKPRRRYWPQELGSNVITLRPRQASA